MYYTFPALLLEWEKDFGWSKTELTGALTLAPLVSASSAPFAGRIIDRGHGRILITGAALVGAGLLVPVAPVTPPASPHHASVTGGGPRAVQIPSFRWVNTTIGNIKNSIRGTYHAIRPKHVPRYLAQFEYRFNRRYRLEDMIPRLAWVALRTPPMPYRLLKLAENSA